MITTKSRIVHYWLIVGLIVICFQKISAIPAFAKKYGKPCQTCHITEPKLNAFGELFRINGYQLRGTEEDTPPWAVENVQLSGMLHEMYVIREISNNMDAVPPPGIPSGESYKVNSFRDMGGHLWMAGSLGRKLSFFATLGIESEVEVSNGRFGSETHVHWDQAFFQYNNMFNSWAHLTSIKFGLFELELPFSALRNLGSTIAPYEVYDIRGVKGAAKLGATQMGTSFNGLSHFGVNSLRYELAMINGTNGNFDSNVEFDLYSRIALARLFDKFLHRIQVGFLYYSGTQNLKDLPGNPFPNSAMLEYWQTDSSFLEFNESPLNVHINPENTNFNRWGVDGSIDFELAGFPINIYGQYLVGHDDDIDMTNEEMPELGSEVEDGGDDHVSYKRLITTVSEDRWITRPFDYSGGFIGVDVVLKPAKLFFTPRFDWISVSNQWADKVDGDRPRDKDEMIWGNTNELSKYSSYILGLRYHPIMPLTIVFEWGVQENLFGFPEPDEHMYNPAWVAGMGRVVDIDSNWFMIMVMFVF